MRSLPTVDYPDKMEGVTLKCSRIQETVTRNRLHRGTTLKHSE
jgi:hypothetical protein